MARRVIPAAAPALAGDGVAVFVLNIYDFLN
jgi:hypothetical protein